MVELEVTRDPIDLNEFDSDMRAALGGKYYGASSRKGVVVLHLSDDATPSEVNQARSIFNAAKAAVDPTKPPLSVGLAERADRGRSSIRQLDFNDIQTRINNISNLAEAKTFLIQLTQAVYFLAAAQGFTDQDLDS